MVLELGQIDQDAGGGMLHLELAEDGGAVVGDEDVADVVDEHLVEADGSQGRLDDVGHGEGGRYVADANILTGLALAIEELDGIYEERRRRGGHICVRYNNASGSIEEKWWISTSSRRSESHSFFAGCLALHGGILRYSRH